MKEYEKILLPLDFSESSVYAGKRARRMAENYGADLTILHVIDYLPPTYATAELPAELSSKEYFLKHATSHVKKWAADNDLEHCEMIIEFGQPKKIITQALKKDNFDLVILAPHENNPFIRLFGSVTNVVAQQTNCDVLILREHKQSK